MTFASVFRPVLGVIALVLGMTLGSPSVFAANHGQAEAQKKAVESVVREYLRKNPEVLVEAIRALRDKSQAENERQAKNTLESLRPQIENSPYSPVGGNPNGDVTVVEFFDYRCPYCKKVFPDLVILMKEDKGVRFVFKEFPILGPVSVFASRAALAAWSLDKSKYMAFHSAMMASRGQLTEKRIFKMAKRSGFDPDKLRTAMDDPGVADEIRRNATLAESLNINGTPAFIIGDALVPGAIDLGALKSLVAKARGRK